MKTPFEPCFYLDVDALRPSEDDDKRATPHITENCAGKTLLMIGPGGFEVLHVPTVLH